MMDIQIPFIFVSLFSLASVVLIFIYKFGIKEKSYEEALAEQRQQTHILLGIKPKSKEKKNKKPTKKVQSAKEKSTSDEGENIENTEPEQTEVVQKSSELQKKPHVEFKETTEDVTTKNVGSKKQTKKEKVRPILIHKESDPGNVINTESPTAPANHFEELHPKDDFELFRSTSAEDATREEAEKHTTKTEIVHQKKQEPETSTAPRENGPPIATPAVNGIIANTGKEKKKKKSEFNTLQQLAGDSNGPNMSVLLNLVRKAELSRSEVQILIDLLLNKLHEAPAVLDEWSEGKSDPVQKLKKQLAEKEKLLLEEQQAVAGAQTKLREIRAEYQNEKSGLQQKIRSMEEMIHTKQMEATRNHQQVQQLQAQIKEELVKYHKLREEHGALQMQRQQYEIRLGQAQESEVIINQLQTEVQELSTINNQLQMELGRLTEESMAEKERSQSYIVQLSNFQKELEQKTERTRQLEETHLSLEHDFQTCMKQEGDFKSEISRLTSVIQQQNEEIRRLEHNTKQFHDELQKYKDDSTKVVGQLTADLRQVQEENVQLKLTHMNGSLQENKQHEVEILNLHNELSSVKTQLSQLEKKGEIELKAANAVAEKLRQEIKDLTVKIEEERTKLEEQKTKNNELRTKNWKVMEALNAAESRIKNNTSNARTKSDDEIQREFIQRLFPEVKDSAIVDPEIFKVEGEKFIRSYVANLRTQQVKDSDDCDVTQLKLQLQHYKNVIDNAEKMLNKLQKHIEQEEINWRMQLAAKTAELDSFKSNHAQELQKLTSLEVELKKEQEDKKRIIAELQQFQDSQAQNSSNGLH